MNAPILFDSHMHTPLCKHARGEPEAYAKRAVEVGLKGIIFTCHSPMPKGWWPRVRMSIEEFDTYVKIVQRAADAFEGQLEIKLGMESDYFRGMDKWLTELHQRADFHHVLGSVHYFAPEYMERHGHLSDEDFIELYFDQLAESAESGLFDTLAHPDLVKNHSPEMWNQERFTPCIAKALDRIAATGVAMELNTSGRNKRVPEFNPAPWILQMIAERGIPIVIGSDSHIPERVGDAFPDALATIKHAGFEKVSYFDNRQLVDLPINEVAKTPPQ